MIFDKTIKNSNSASQFPWWDADVYDDEICRPLRGRDRFGEICTFSLSAGQSWRVHCSSSLCAFLWHPAGFPPPFHAYMRLVPSDVFGGMVLDFSSTLTLHNCNSHLVQSKFCNLGVYLMSNFSWKLNVDVLNWNWSHTRMKQLLADPVT